MCNLSYGILEEGIERGRIEALADLVKDGILNMKDAAERLGLSEKEFERLMEKTN